MFFIIPKQPFDLSYTNAKKISSLSLRYSSFFKLLENCVLENCVACYF